ncbi:MAG: hypothetical protein ACM3NH_00520 [Candidatus Saccharibacteria bacterium]
MDRRPEYDGSFTEEPLPIEERPLAELEPGDWFAAALQDGEAKMDATGGQVPPHRNLEQIDSTVDPKDQYQTRLPRKSYLRF